MVQNQQNKLNAHLSKPDAAFKIIIFVLFILPICPMSFYLKSETLNNTTPFHFRLHPPPLQVMLCVYSETERLLSYLFFAASFRQWQDVYRQTETLMLVDIWQTGEDSGSKVYRYKKKRRQGFFCSPSACITDWFRSAALSPQSDTFSHQLFFF